MKLRLISPEDYLAVATLVCDSTNAWYQAKGNPPIFTGGPESTLLFCEVYEALDPGCCILAEEESSGRLMGSCFFHPRTTHVSLGIMNVHAEFFGQGVARKLLQYVVDFAYEKRLPIRLVSSAMNLDSFSLYSKAGFVPFQSFQDMIVTIPENGIGASEEFIIDSSTAEMLRDVTGSDVDQMVDLEMSVAGIDRRKDFEYFIANESGHWHTSVCENEGQIIGFLTSISHPGSSMIGPGVFRDSTAAVALLRRELDFRAGKTMVFLAPTDCRPIVEFGYSIGAKNCEMHFAQVLGNAKSIEGVVMPTFMPETG